MRISLSKLIEKYYDQIGYLGTQYTKSHKQVIQISNIDFAETLIMHYDNLKLIRTHSQYAPEMKKAFIVLK